MNIGELLLDMEQENAGAGCCGVVTGIVKENWNEESKGMVLVELSCGEEGKTDTEWIPVMQPYCGNGFGQYYLPEIDSQVVVAFLGGDINCPIVLGCLWNDTDLLPEETAKEDNSLKKIQTKAGNCIVIDDTEGKESIGIHTKGGESIVLSDENKSAVIQDNDGKTKIILDMNNGEIKLSAEKKLVLSVGGDDVITINGTSKQISLSSDSLQAEAKQNLKVNTQNLQLKGNITEIKSQGSAKLDCSGILELKGSLVKIN